jgi:fructose-bisphosphate aldolase class 1
MPIIEPEVSIKIQDKAGAEAILLAEVTKRLNALPEGRSAWSRSPAALRGTGLANAWQRIMA